MARKVTGASITPEAASENAWETPFTDGSLPAFQPGVVSARRWTGTFECAIAIHEWSDGEVAGLTGRLSVPSRMYGWVLADQGHWIIKGPDGYSVLDQEQFERTTNAQLKLHAMTTAPDDEAYDTAASVDIDAWERTQP
jgi:hypothetical protein